MNVSGMVRNRRLARAIADASMAGFSLVSGYKFDEFIPREQPDISFANPVNSWERCCPNELNLFDNATFKLLVD